MPTGLVGARVFFQIFEAVSVAVRRTLLVVPVHDASVTITGALVSIETVMVCVGDLFPAVSMTPTT